MSFCAWVNYDATLLFTHCESFNMPKQVVIPKRPKKPSGVLPVRKRRALAGATPEVEVIMEDTLTERRTAENKRLFLAALKQSLGVIALAAEKTGVANATVSRWRKEDLSFDGEVRETLHFQYGYVFAKFLKNIENGDARSQIFYLRTKGRAIDPEWGDRTEITGANGGPVQLEASAVHAVRAEFDQRSLALAMQAAMTACPEVFNVEPDDEQ